MVEGSESLNFNIPTHLPRVISEEENANLIRPPARGESQENCLLH